MIVAGGGSGGAMCYKKKTTSTTVERSETLNWTFCTVVATTTRPDSYSFPSGGYTQTTTTAVPGLAVCLDLSSYTFPVTIKFYVSVASDGGSTRACTSLSHTDWSQYQSEFIWLGSGTGQKTYTLTDSTHPIVFLYCNDNRRLTISNTERVWSETSTSTTTDTDYQVGGVGGGTQGGAYSSTYAGKQNAAGSGGSFGQGAAQSVTNYRYCSGAGGGGWYGGGGGQKSDSSMTYCKYSGGGSGFVNIAASAGNRPSGYTGLELDSGTTYAGNTSFPNTAGTGNETGHSGNGYAKITRLS